MCRYSEERRQDPVHQRGHFSRHPAAKRRSRTRRGEERRRTRRIGVEEAGEVKKEEVEEETGSWRGRGGG